ncbi:Beta-glucosidase 11-like protein [Drosera capensis]
MARFTLSSRLFFLLPLAVIGTLAAVPMTTAATVEYGRRDFPDGFIFGSGTSSYQVEGATNEDGRTPSIFDAYEDVQLMVDTGLDAYRFSIAWSRLIPNGRGPVNPKGLQYYNNLINELIRHGIEPHVTLMHVDLPLALEDEYGGFLDRKIVRDFTAYANVCFREFGDRVLHWTTVNEGNIFVVGGYDFGQTPPQHCSPAFGPHCKKGNSSIEPYIAAHNMLLAHASIVRLYKRKYQVKQQGIVGINLLAYRALPSTNSTEDLEASKRANDFFIGWFMDPLNYGDYPEVMKRRVGKRLPVFSKSESRLVKGAFDFIAINHYTTTYAKNGSGWLELLPSDFFTDMAVEMTFQADNTPPGGYPVIPWSMQQILEYFKQVYGNPPIYIHENGQRTDRSNRTASLNDTTRVEYLQAFIGSLLDATRNGSNVRGYFTWSFLDLFELVDGNISSYGLYYVDFEDQKLTRVIQHQLGFGTMVRSIHV